VFNHFHLPRKCCSSFKIKGKTVPQSSRINSLWNSGVRGRGEGLQDTLKHRGDQWVIDHKILKPVCSD
jgi:hypothetical protein